MRQVNFWLRFLAVPFFQESFCSNHTGGQWCSKVFNVFVFVSFFSESRVATRFLSFFYVCLFCRIPDPLQLHQPCWYSWKWDCSWYQTLISDFSTTSYLSACYRWTDQKTVGSQQYNNDQQCNRLIFPSKHFDENTLFLLQSLITGIELLCPRNGNNASFDVTCKFCISKL